MIYKILRVDEYMELVVEGETKGSPADQKDGYIHFSTLAQLPGTLAKHYKGEEELYLLAYDDKSLDALKWEEARGGALFPHLYGMLNMYAADEVYELHGHDLPKDLR